MRLSRIARSSVALGFGLLAGLIAGCAATTPTITLDSTPTAEGLYEITGTDADQAWARSDVDMAQYSKIAVADIEIDYRPGGDSQTMMTRTVRRSGGPFEVTDEQKEEFRPIAEEEILEDFASSRRFALVDEPGPGVLLVTVKLADVVSYIPPEVAGRNASLASEYGEATLVLELRDSTTEAIVARVVDRRTAERIDRRVDFNAPITTAGQVEELFGSFARTLRQRLDEVGSLGM